MQIKLRENAEERLNNGTAPIMQGWPTGTQALTLLYNLASAPESASDALKLLHELQVHQVELDLQHEHAEQERRQLVEDLKNSTALFDLAPFGYLMLDPEGMVVAANRIATDWLAGKTGAVDEWGGRRIEDLLAPECRSTIRDMLVRVRQGQGRQNCAMQSRAGGASAQAVASAAPGSGQVLMAFTPPGPPGH